MTPRTEINKPVLSLDVLDEMQLDDAFLFPVSSRRVCSSSETESEAGDLLEQQFEELNNKLTSATDPTGYLRMVSRNNLFNRSEFGPTAGRGTGPTLIYLKDHWIDLPQIFMFPRGLVMMILREISQQLLDILSFSPQMLRFPLLCHLAPPSGQSLNQSCTLVYVQKPVKLIC